MSEKTTTKYHCDICGLEMNLEEMCVDEHNVIKLKTIMVDIYYQGVFCTRHTCVKCSKSIINHLKSLSLDCMLHTSDWSKK